MPTLVHTPAEIGDMVRRARLSMAVSQQVVAAAAGVGIRFVVELERGKPTVQLGKVIAVLGALDLDLAVTVTREGLRRERRRIAPND